jgi:hypothetical protein
MENNNKENTIEGTELSIRRAEEQASGIFSMFNRRSFNVLHSAKLRSEALLLTSSYYMNSNLKR